MNHKYHSNIPYPFVTLEKRLHFCVLYPVTIRHMDFFFFNEIQIIYSNVLLLKGENCKVGDLARVECEGKGCKGEG